MNNFVKYRLQFSLKRTMEKVLRVIVKNKNRAQQVEESLSLLINAAHHSYNSRTRGNYTHWRSVRPPFFRWHACALRTFVNKRKQCILMVEAFLILESRESRVEESCGRLLYQLYVYRNTILVNILAIICTVDRINARNKNLHCC